MRSSAAASLWDGIQIPMEVDRRPSLLLSQQPTPSLRTWALRVLPQHRRLLLSHHLPTTPRPAAELRASLKQMGRPRMRAASTIWEKHLRHSLLSLLHGGKPAQTCHQLGSLGGAGSPMQQRPRPQHQRQAQGVLGVQAWVAGPCQMTAQQTHGCLAVYCTMGPRAALQQVLPAFAYVGCLLRTAVPY